MKKSIFKSLFVAVCFFTALTIHSCSGGGAEWAEGTWERADGLVSLTVENGALDYSQAKLDGVKPSTSNGEKIVWNAKTAMGEAKITLEKVSETEAKLITNLGDASEEHTFTKKEE